MERRDNVLKEYSLDGKVAIVTGAAQGIGKGIASTLAEAGADIVISDIDTVLVEQTAAEVRQLGVRCLAIVTDVTNAKQVEEMVDRTASELGRVDILVNNAGTSVTKPLIPLLGFESSGATPDFSVPTSEEEWHRVIDTNLTGTFLCTRAVGRHMMEQRSGRIINISSLGAVKASLYRSSYDVTKAGISAFTRAIAVEWARYNITVNAIGPGWVHTRLTAPVWDDEKLRERFLRAIPMRRTATPREIGLLAVYLASEASSYVTGQTIYIDGGVLA